MTYRIPHRWFRSWRARRTELEALRANKEQLTFDLEDLNDEARRIHKYWDAARSEADALKAQLYQARTELAAARAELAVVKQSHRRPDPPRT